ncbi:MAG: hypothetical protein PHV17_00285 [Candidatus Omnitrophica bacterium]|nr:hypothetical protein [Candidatus Omnitrophota bacterium]
MKKIIIILFVIAVFPSLVFCNQAFEDICLSIWRQDAPDDLHNLNSKYTGSLVSGKAIVVTVKKDIYGDVTVSLYTPPKNARSIKIEAIIQPGQSAESALQMRQGDLAYFSGTFSGLSTAVSQIYIADAVVTRHHDVIIRDDIDRIDSR